MVHYAAFIFGDGNARVEDRRPAVGLAAAVGFAAAIALPAPSVAAAGPEQGPAHVAFRPARNGLRPGRASRDLYSATVIEGDLRAAAHLRLPRAAGEARADGWPRRCRRSPTTARPTRSSSARASTSRRIRRSRARSASSSRRTSSTRSCGSSTRRTARRTRSCSKARSSAWTSSPRRPKKTGKFDYDAKIPGMEAVDRYTLRFRLTETDYNFLYITAHASLGDRRARGDRGLRRRHDGASGRHRAVHAEELDRGARRSCSRPIPSIAASSGISAVRRPAWDDDARRRTMRGKQMPQIGRVEISDHRGGAVALARVPAEGDRLPRPCRRRSRRTRSTATS